MNPTRAMHANHLISPAPGDAAALSGWQPPTHTHARPRKRNFSFLRGAAADDDDDDVNAPLLA